MSRKNYEMSNCERMLIITIYKMSNATRWYPVAKSDQDR